MFSWLKKFLKMNPIIEGYRPVGEKKITPPPPPKKSRMYIDQSIFDGFTVDKFLEEFPIPDHVFSGYSSYVKQQVNLAIKDLICEIKKLESEKEVLIWHGDSTSSFKSFTTEPRQNLNILFEYWALVLYYRIIESNPVYYFEHKNNPYLTHHFKTHKLSDKEVNINLDLLSSTIKSKYGKVKDAHDSFNNYLIVQSIFYLKEQETEKQLQMHYDKIDNWLESISTKTKDLTSILILQCYAKEVKEASRIVSKIRERYGESFYIIDTDRGQGINGYYINIVLSFYDTLLVEKDEGSEDDLGSQLILNFD